ncbi:MAG: GNAT family N-acetyltransferase [Pseudomonadota bacterium]
MAHAQVLVRRTPFLGHAAMLARGPVWCDPLDPNVARASLQRLWQQLSEDHRMVLVTPDLIDGLDPMTSGPLLLMVSAGTTARLSLNGSAEDRIARMHGKWRNRWRRAEDGPLKVSQGPLPDDQSHWLLQNEARQARRRRYRRLPPIFTQAWRRVNGPQSTRLFAVSLKGSKVAGMLLLIHGDTASYHVGWSDDVGRQHHAHTLLLARAMAWAAEAGLQWIDLGTLDTATTPGLARFKLGSGAVPVSLGSTWLDAPGAQSVARLAKLTGGTGPSAAPTATAQQVFHPIKAGR